MPIFICAVCGCKDNTALTGYWHKTADGEPPLCSACDPDIAAWHDRFPRVQATDEERAHADEHGLMQRERR